MRPQNMKIVVFLLIFLEKMYVFSQMWAKTKKIKDLKFFQTLRVEIVFSKF